MQKNKLIYIAVLLVLSAYSRTAFGQLQVLKVQEDIKVAGKTTDALVDAASVTEKRTTYKYYDGFGRPVETNSYHASPTLQDIIQPMGYNSVGQQATNYLPYTDGFAYEDFRGGVAAAGQATFYNTTATYLVARDNSPYSSAVFENSPLQRVLSAGMVGDGFQPGGTGTPHYKTVTYRSNNTTADGGIFVWYPNGTYVPGTLYGTNSLQVTDGKDEDNIEKLIYADAAGHVVLKRQVHAGGNLDTYYVYNMAGMLSYVIPPNAVALLAAHSYSLAAAPINKMVYNYTYDIDGRVVTKTVPTAGTIYVVYDSWNRPVLLQDVKLRAGNKWNYIKYDVKGRVISQGIYLDATHTTQSAMQTYVNTFSTNWYESRSATVTGGGYYTNGAFPTTGTTPLSYAYFDNYDLNQDGTDDFAETFQSDANLLTEEHATSAKLRGVPTIISQTTVGNGITTGMWLTKATFYDIHGNPIQVKSNNQVSYTSPTTLTDTKTIVPDFTGVPQAVKTVQTGSATVTVYTAFTYDHMYRLTGVSQKYNTGAMQAVAAYSYNEIGQVIQKGLGYVSSGVWLQNLDMRYNIRGQLLTINNSTLTNDMTTSKTNGDTNDVFGMQMFYDAADVGGVGNTARFNGRLTGVKWMSKDGAGAATRERSYKFVYDDLGRYTDENYGERTTAGTGAFSANPNTFDEYGITYDAGGNITALKRNSGAVGGSGHTTIDNLVYNYDGTNNPNQLLSMTETGTAAGFPTGSGSYLYEANGNLATDPYKGLTLTYNDINKTNVITVTAGSGQHIDYTYDGAGNLLRKQVYNASAIVSTTDYVDGFVYIKPTTGTSALSYFPMPEGRVLFNSGTFTQEFIVTDQQGNARLSFQNNAGTVKAMQENSYYGYGMVTVSAMSLPTTPNNQLYNDGSEWQNDYSNKPDYYQTFYRNYDAALGRFVATDPKAEVTESLSTYHYAGNNPVMFNDPDGDYAGQGQPLNSGIVSLSDFHAAYKAFWGPIGEDIHISENYIYSGAKEVSDFLSMFGIGGGAYSGLSTAIIKGVTAKGEDWATTVSGFWTPKPQVIQNLGPTIINHDKYYFLARQPQTDVKKAPVQTPPYTKFPHPIKNPADLWAQTIQYSINPPGQDLAAILGISAISDNDHRQDTGQIPDVF